MKKIVVRNSLEYRLKVNKAADNFKKPKRKVLATPARRIRRKLHE